MLTKIIIVIVLLGGLLEKIIFNAMDVYGNIITVIT